MAAKEAKARIKINRLLEESGWRFFDDAKGKANVVLEPRVRLTKAAIEALGDNFEDANNGFIDFLLLDEAGFPLLVLEAKSEDKNPLVGKEQARKYAKSQSCRFVILSNGNLHYFWDLEQGNPHIVTRFPAPDSIKSYHRFQQQYTINFTNNNLLGSANFLDAYKTSKARICVTVGMMTTGYDCPDILNLALMRPVFSPSDFVQIKGRGTRKHGFPEQLFDKVLKAQIGKQEKTQFKFFDFFANCEYFEEKFNYDEVLKLPRPGTGGDGPERPTPPPMSQYEHKGDDALKLFTEQPVGPQGMKIDRMFFEDFEKAVKADPFLQQKVDNEQWDQAIDYVTTHLLDKPAEFYTLDKLRRAAGVDRRLTLREILEKIFGFIPGFKSKDELLEDEFQKFLLDQSPGQLSKHADAIVALKYFFKAYATDGRLRDIIEKGHLTDLNVNPAFSMADFKAVPKEWRKRIPEYVKDYVSLNQFM
jgi:type I restriction enzyme R subunit